MLPTTATTFEHNEVCRTNKSYLKYSFFFFFSNAKKNKENFEFISTKQIDDDAESSHSDCLIIEPDVSIPTPKDVSH